MENKLPKYLYYNHVKGNIYIVVKVPNAKSRTFNLNNYTSEERMIQDAIEYRDQLLYDTRATTTKRAKEVARRDKYTVAYAYERSKVLIKNSVNTIQKNDLKFKKYFQGIQNKKIQEINAADLLEFFNQWVNYITDDNMNRLHYIWKKIFRAAIIDEVVKTNYADVIQLPKSKQPYLKIKSETDLATVMNVIDALESRRYYRKGDQYNHKLMVYVIKIILHTGMRPSEVYALTTSDIDFTAKVIHVYKRVGSDYNQMITLVTPKTPNAVRDIPIGPDLEAILHELIEFAKTDQLFQLANGRLMSHNFTCTLIRNTCRQIGCSFHVYQLRHLFSREIGKVASSRTLMELMGHSSINQSVYYQWSTPEEKRKAILERDSKFLN